MYEIALIFLQINLLHVVGMYRLINNNRNYFGAEISFHTYRKCRDPVTAPDVHVLKSLLFTVT